MGISNLLLLLYLDWLHTTCLMINECFVCLFVFNAAVNLINQRKEMLTLEDHSKQKTVSNRMPPSPSATFTTPWSLEARRLQLKTSVRLTLTQAEKRLKATAHSSLPANPTNYSINHLVELWRTETLWWFCSRGSNVVSLSSKRNMFPSVG